MRLPTRKSERDRRLLQSDGPVHLTKAGIVKLKRTIERIEKELPHLRDEVTRTAAMGDLSENAAYQTAKHELRRNQGRLFHLKERLKNVVEIDETAADTVRLGSTVTIILNGHKQTYQLVGPHEANPMKGRISHISPLGNALLGLRVNQQATFTGPNGENSIELLTIS